MAEILGQFFGILVMIGCIVNNQFPKRWQMLLGLAVINLFSSLNQLLVGSGLTAALLGFVAVIHCPINAYKSKKELPIHLWENIFFSILYLSAWVVGFIVSTKNGTPLYLDIMTLLATVCFLGSVFFPKERDIRLCTLTNSFIYFVYDTLNLNIAAVAKLFSVISAVIALYRYRNKGKKDDISAS